MLIATEHRVYHLQQAGDEPDPIYEGPIAAIAEGPENGYVALRDGIVVVLPRARATPPADPDNPWEIVTGIADPVASLAVLADGPTPHLLLGTDEGAHLYACRGGPAERVEAFDALDCRSGWHTPWGGPPAVRTLAVTPDGWVYADIHVGSIMRSPDGGQTWQPVTPELNEDVHEVTVTSAAPDRVVANTARGVYVSDDRGHSWHDRGQGLGHRYGRAAAAHPVDADILLASVSDGPHGDNVHGQLYRSDDAGRSWTQIAGPVPHSTRENINTGRLAFTPDGTAWAAIGRQLFAGARGGEAWRMAFEAPEAIEKLSAHA